METDYEFPEIPQDALAQIQGVKAIAEENPDAIHSDDCPYPQWFKDLIAPRSTSDSGEESQIQLEERINGIMEDLQGFRENLSMEDTKELNTYFRLIVALLEKLTTMKERADKINQINDFKQTVLQILEDEMPTDTRTRVINRLKEFT